MKDNIRVALVQPKPYPSFDDPRNLGHALLLLEKCRGEDLDLVVLPEYFPYHGEREVAGAARQLNAYVVAGLVETEGGRTFNTATLFDRSGRLLGRQRKNNVASLERSDLGIVPGDGSYRAFTADFGRIGMPVAADLWGQPEAARQLTDLGADMLVSIGVFPILRGHCRTGALVRAFDNFIPVVTTNTADYNALIHNRRIHLHGGHSLVIQPPKMLDRHDFRRWLRSVDTVDDWVRVELDELEQIHVAEVNLSTARRFRKEFWERLGYQRLPSL
ncbi:MAG: carbon-nitrogen hydrolase family protein [Deltaproteobacteria bacterium]|nr:carbon-nitrogen hydrolase family protein [Deltaproteobacteria bacterium]